MVVFENHLVTFEIPDDWSDRTAVVYTEPRASGVPASITLVRAPAMADDTASSRAKAALRRMQDELPAAELLKENVFEVGRGVPAVQHLVSWRRATAQMLQVTTTFLRDETCWHLTATLPARRSGALYPVVKQALASLKVEEPRTVVLDE